jgi:ATP-dependent exoDNAse (exonuclease V) alpha subunit
LKVFVAHSPPSFSDRSVLWNSVEKIEKSRNAQPAREIEIALPVELDRQEQIRIVRAYVRDTFVASGMCADFSIHDKGDGNPHVHIMLTLRPQPAEKERRMGCEVPEGIRPRRARPAHPAPRRRLQKLPGQRHRLEQSGQSQSMAGGVSRICESGVGTEGIAAAYRPPQLRPAGH